MRISTTILAAATLLAATPSATAGENQKKIPSDFWTLRSDMGEAMRRLAPNADMKLSPRFRQVSKLNNDIITRLEAAKAGIKATEVNATRDALDIEPNTSYEPSTYFGDIDGPNGELWYYSMDCYCTEIEYEFYTQYVLQEYTFNIFNSRFEYVTTIHDKMRYRDDESHHAGTLLQGVSLLPVVTKHYFNSDDKYEFVVSLITNFKDTYGVRNRSAVYQMGGEKETVSIPRADGTEETVLVDKPIAEIDGFICDVLDASTPDQENFYFTFMGDLDVDWIDPYASEDETAADDEVDTSYWDMISNAGSIFTTYAKAGADGKLVEIFSKELPYIRQQGDQESTPAILSFARDGQGYILMPYYKETYYNPYYNYNDDFTMRDNNSLVIDLYKVADTGAEVINTTEIPVTKLDMEGVLATYYSVGDLRYSSDVMFDADGQPMYVVTRSNYDSTSDDTAGFCYYVYNVKGEKMYTIYEFADSDLSLYNIDGQPDLHMFVEYDDFDGYTYHMIDLSNGKETAHISANLDTGMDELELLMANMDRVPVGDTYKYAFEMRSPLTDEDDNTYMRIAWFNADGTFDRIDYINMGNDVEYAQTYVSGSALRTDLFNDDALHEYMILIKRGLPGEGDQEELIVGQGMPDEFTPSNTLLHLRPDSAKGTLRSIGLYPGVTDTDTRMVIYYGKDDLYSVDIYDLPFGINSAIDTVIDTAEGLTYSNGILTAKGLEINVYNTSGAVVASGKETLHIGKLPVGVYVAKAGDSVNKFIIK